MKDLTKPRRFFVRPSRPLLAVLVLGLGGALLGGPAAHAGTTTTSGTHTPAPEGPITQHIIWGSIRYNSPQNPPAASAAAAPAHIEWVRVRVYEDGGYAVLPDDVDEDDSEDLTGDDGMDDSIVTFVPLAVSD